MGFEKLVKQLFCCVWVVFYSLTHLCYAQSTNDCGTKGVTRTIKAEADATALASCTVFSGSIAVATAAANIKELNIDGVQEVLENIVVQDVGNLVTFAGKDLRRINGDFIYRNLTTISNTSFPVLTTVGTISFIGLASSSRFNFSAGITSVANVTISDTFLSTLEGVNLKNADIVQIDNNLRLSNITLPLETAKTRIVMTANSRNANVKLPQLTSAGSIALANISTVAMPSLSFLSGNLSIQSSYMTDISADSLSVITQKLYLKDNTQLKRALFAGLLSASSIEITNNSLLTNMTFEKLSRADSALFNGSFSSIEMPGLTSVNGTFSVQTTNPKFNCSIFDARKASSIIKGDYACQGTHQVLAGATQTPASTNNATSNTTNSTNAGPAPDKSSGLSTGAKAGVGISSTAVVLLAISGFLFFMRRKNKKSKPVNTEEEMFAKAEMDGTGKPQTELDGSKVLELHEQNRVAEMNAKGPVEHVELPGDHKFVPVEMGEGKERAVPTKTKK